MTFEELKANLAKVGSGEAVPEDRVLLYVFHSTAELVGVLLNVGADKDPKRVPPALVCPHLAPKGTVYVVGDEELATAILRAYEPEV